MLRRLEEGLARRETRLCPAAGDAKRRALAVSCTDKLRLRGGVILLRSGVILLRLAFLRRAVRQRRRFQTKHRGKILQRHFLSVQRHGRSRTADCC